MREVQVIVPVVQSTPASPGTSTTMEIDAAAAAAPKTYATTTRTSHVASDGLLLYVSQASYEPGTSPLSSWIPILKPDDAVDPAQVTGDAEGGPLDMFERRVVFNYSRQLSG